MTGHEAREFLAVFRATWPKFARDDVSTTLWMGHLARVDYAIASTALSNLAANLDDPPSVKQWQEACRSAWSAVKPARVLETSTGGHNPDDAPRLVAPAREALAKAAPYPTRKPLFPPAEETA